MIVAFLVSLLSRNFPIIFFSIQIREPWLWERKDKRWPLSDISSVRGGRPHQSSSWLNIIFFKEFSLFFPPGLKYPLGLLSFQENFGPKNRKFPATFQCRHRLNYNDGVLDSVRWYKVMGGREMVNFYTYKPGGLERDRKQTKHRLQGINVLVSQIQLMWGTCNIFGLFRCLAPCSLFFYIKLFCKNFLGIQALFFIRLIAIKRKNQLACKC